MLYAKSYANFMTKYAMFCSSQSTIYAMLFRLLWSLCLIMNLQFICFKILYFEYKYIVFVVFIKGNKHGINIELFYT